MAKYRVVQKGSLVTVKSKLSRKDVINEREIDYLMQNYTQGLFRMSYGGKRQIEYTAPVSVPLSKYLNTKLLNEHSFWMIIVQIVEMEKKIEKLGLHPNNLWLDMDTIFINETSLELYFLYQPFVSSAFYTNGFALINDITYAEVKKNIGSQDGYLKEFQEFLCSGTSYRLEIIEDYITDVYPEIFKSVGNSDRGKSGFLTTDRAAYKKHYKEKTKRKTGRENGTICLIEDEDGTVCLSEDEEDEEGTVVLGAYEEDEDDYGATSLLVTKEEKKAILINVKNGDSKEIAQDVFSIGKIRTANFCIAGNTAVSRNHALIFKRDNEFYLMDNKSTNGTFLNDRRLSEGEEALLEDGDKIVFADEEFEIEIR